MSKQRNYYTKKNKKCKDFLLTFFKKRIKLIYIREKQVREKVKSKLLIRENWPQAESQSKKNGFEKLPLQSFQ